VACPRCPSIIGPHPFSSPLSLTSQTCSFYCFFVDMAFCVRSLIEQHALDAADGGTMIAKTLFQLLAGDAGFIVWIVSARAFLISNHLAPRRRPHGKAKHLSTPREQG
jgi:hypothetical protein